MKSLTEIYNQLKEASVLPNTGANRPRADSNMTSGGGRSYPAGQVPQPSVADFVKKDVVLKSTPTPGNTARAPLKDAGRPVISTQAKERAETIVKARQQPQAKSTTGSPEIGSSRAREGSAERGHATGSKFTQGPKANARDARGVESPMKGQGSSGQKATDNNVQLKLKHQRELSKTGQNSALDTTRDAKLDKPVERSNMATAYANKDGGKSPGSAGADRLAKAKTAPAPAKGQAQAATPAKSQASPGTAGKVAKPEAKPAEKEMTFGQAFAAARKKAGGAGGVFTYKGKKYQTNVKGEKYLKQSKLKSVDEATDHKALYKKIRSILTEAEKHIDHGSVGSKFVAKKSVYKSTLGALEKRKWSAIQDRTPASYSSSKKMVAEKNTDTGETEDEITISPKEKGKANNTINTGSTATQNQ